MPVRPMLILWLLLFATFMGHRAAGLDAPQQTEPPTIPILRVETGSHTTRVTALALSVDNHTLVTVSCDKTLRIWELPGGRLLHILRPPIASGHEGDLTAVALSPDGRTLACGGLTGMTWDGTLSIYLFDVSSGELVRRIPGLPEVITDLSYSPDGRFLAAAIGHTTGLKIYQTTDYAQVAEDTGYGDDCYSVEFDRTNRIVTASRDGLIRLYGSDFHLLTKRGSPGGKIPLRARFSPDGRKIAVGFDDSLRVDVLAGNDLTPLTSHTTPLYKNGNPPSIYNNERLPEVCWSADGQRLYSAGFYFNAQNIGDIRYWSGEGLGASSDLPIGRVDMDVVQDIKPLNSGGVIFGTGDPWVVRMSASGKLTTLMRPAIINGVNVGERFQLSWHGNVVRFGYEAGGESPARFWADSLTLKQGIAATAPTLSSPLSQWSGIEVTDWLASEHPKLNGKPLPLEKGEQSHSYALTPHGRYLILGAEWHLYCFDAEGGLRWQANTPEIAFGVNVSRDGKLVVASFADGTIRWYRLNDGTELLALFPHPDHKRWVAWTPMGYYACSPGGEDLIGWHLNQGKEHMADFFPISCFRTLYYRPDVVAQVLKVQDEDKAVKTADAVAGQRQQRASLPQALPPVVRLVSPQDSATMTTSQVNLHYVLRSPSGEPITSLKVLVDGRPVSDQENLHLTAGEETQEITAPIPQRDCEVTLLAANRYAVSVPAVLRLHHSGGPLSGPAMMKPRLTVLTIGVSQYSDPHSSRLLFTARDARNLADILLQQKGTLFGDVQVRALGGVLATRQTVRASLDWLSQQTNSGDVALIFLAGHIVGQDDKLYFLPADGTLEHIGDTGVPLADFGKSLAAVQGRAVFMVDVSYPGVISGTPPERHRPDITGFINELSSVDKGTVVFSGWTGDETTVEDQALGNDAFARALCEGLSGKADTQHTGLVTATMLDRYVAERVKILSRGTQHPLAVKPPSIPDFPLAVVPANANPTPKQPKPKGNR